MQWKKNFISSKLWTKYKKIMRFNKRGANSKKSKNHKMSSSLILIKAKLCLKKKR